MAYQPVPVAQGSYVMAAPMAPQPIAVATHPMQMQMVSMPTAYQGNYVVQSPYAAQTAPAPAMWNSPQGAVQLPPGYMLVQGPNGQLVPMMMMAHPDQLAGPVAVGLPSQYIHSQVGVTNAAPPTKFANAGGQVAYAAPAAAPAAAKPAENKDPAPASFKPVAGHVKATVHAAKGLMNTKCCKCFDQDVYTKLTLGTHEEDTPVAKGGGVTPEWASEPTFFLGIGDQDNEKADKLNIQVKVSNTFCDDIIGETDLPLEKLCQEALEQKAGKKLWYWLGKNGSPSAKGGEIALTLRYVSPLTVTLYEAKELTDVQWVGKQDPYTIVEFVGCVVKGDSGVRKTKVHDDGDRNPKWNQSFSFNLFDEQEMAELKEKVDRQPESMKKNPNAGLWLQIMDLENLIDRPIAYCWIDYARAQELRKTRQPTWFDLCKGSKDQKSSEHAGKVLISFS